jgi:predicted Fe-Mo cluster-binding NifX family protein
MKTAFTVWNERIAPLFDVSHEIHILVSDGNQIMAQFRKPLGEGSPAFKARQLAEMGVVTLVCGAISRSAQSILNAYGIKPIAFINGDISAVIEAWQVGTLHTAAFRMPGSWDASLGNASIIRSDANGLEK